MGEIIKLLDERGELIRVRAPVDPEPEITEITDRVSKGPAEQNKALLFENVKDSAMPVLINAFGSERRMAWALGMGNLNELNLKLDAVIDMRLPQGLRAALNRAGDLLGVIKVMPPRITGALDKAQRDLDEAFSIATRGGMRLFEADCHLEYVRWYLAMASAGRDVPAERLYDDARKHLAIAKNMIEEMGYHRRDQEVKELEALL